MTDGMTLAATLVSDHLAGARAMPVVGDMRASQILAHLAAHYTLDTPQTPEEVITDLFQLLRRGGIHASHPAYFGLFNPGVPPVAAAAATLVSALNPQLGAASHGRAAILIEQHVLRCLAGSIGYDPESSAAHFTSGGQEANTEAVLMALTHTFPETRELGIRSLDRGPVLYISEEAHHSFDKAAQVVGLGREAVRRIPVDGAFRMDLAALEEAIAADHAGGRRPMMVVGTAGSTASGSIDDLEAVAGVCHAHGLWFHCDAAWGGAALLSPLTRPHLAGIEQSDSVTWDAHKWLQMPLGAGMFFTRHADLPRVAFATDSPYMPPRHQVGDPYETSMQWSRRGAGIPLLAFMATMGWEGMASMVERMTLLGERLVNRLVAAGFKMVNATPLPVVCFTHPAIERGGTTVQSLAQTVDRTGRAWIAPIELPGGLPALRACITNHLTEDRDLDVLIATLQEAMGTSTSMG